MYFRESGTVETVLKVPDTITTWEADAFCLAAEGFGMAPRADLTVFQPFFLELTLPYSIIHGENFELKATVFSYLSNCIMVRRLEVPALMRAVSSPVTSCSSALKKPSVMVLQQMCRHVMHMCGSVCFNWLCVCVYS